MDFFFLYHDSTTNSRYYQFEIDYSLNLWKKLFKGVQV